MAEWLAEWSTDWLIEWLSGWSTGLLTGLETGLVSSRTESLAAAGLVVVLADAGLVRDGAVVLASLFFGGDGLAVSRGGVAVATAESARGAAGLVVALLATSFSGGRGDLPVKKAMACSGKADMAGNASKLSRGGMLAKGSSGPLVFFLDTDDHLLCQRLIIMGAGFGGVELEDRLAMRMGPVYIDVDPDFRIEHRNAFGVKKGADAFLVFFVGGGASIVLGQHDTEQQQFLVLLLGLGQHLDKGGEAVQGVLVAHGAWHEHIIGNKQGVAQHRADIRRRINEHVVVAADVLVVLQQPGEAEHGIDAGVGTHLPFHTPDGIGNDFKMFGACGAGVRRERPLRVLKRLDQT